MSKEEGFNWPGKYIKKTWEIYNKVRMLKEAYMKRNFNRNQKRISPLDIQLSSPTFLGERNGY